MTNRKAQTAFAESRILILVPQSRTLHGTMNILEGLVILWLDFRREWNDGKQEQNGAPCSQNGWRR